jgi:cell division septum initiation protein DivIVA
MGGTVTLSADELAFLEGRTTTPAVAPQQLGEDVALEILSDPQSYSFDTVRSAGQKAAALITSQAAEIERLREPVTASDVRELVERLEKVAGRVRINNGSFSDIAHEAATALTDLEAENARLRESREFWKRVSDGWSQRAEVYKARLTEALKALDAIIERSNNDPLGTSKVNDMRRIAEDAARRIREGGKVDG